MKMMVSWKRSNNRREEDCEEKESLFEDIVCYILYLIVGCLTIYESFKKLIWGTIFLGGLYIIAYS